MSRRLVVSCHDLVSVGVSNSLPTNHVARTFNRYEDTSESSTEVALRPSLRRHGFYDVVVTN